MKTTLAALTAAAALAIPAAAGAHVTLQPRQAVAGSFSKLDVRVPNERDNKGTIKVDLRLPDGFYFLSYQKVPGWTARVYRRSARPAGRPRRLRGRRAVHPDRVAREKPKRDRIAPGQFQDFPLSVRVPDGAAGTQLVFRAFQTYQGGERVAWTGAPDCRRTGPARHAPGARGGLTEQAASHEIRGEELTSHLFETEDRAYAVQSLLREAADEAIFVGKL